MSKTKEIIDETEGIPLECENCGEPILDKDKAVDIDCYGMQHIYCQTCKPTDE